MKGNEKIQKFIILGIILFAILIIFVSAYLNNAHVDSNLGSNSKEESKLESASTEMGKTIEDASKLWTAEVQTDIAKVEKEKKVEENIQNETDSPAQETVNEEVETSSPEPEKTEEVKFSAPVSGTIIRDFARDSLVYSDTLKEWITHNGVDIKADKTTVVSAAADGKVYAIKNDPRYGLTVIVNHSNGYQTIYSNLLTAEFVVEGEEITQGQSIGTVGNSASFEILDDYHLHFELLQNNEYLDPKIYINFD